ncbi:hypothetical protein U27_04929 [Candidatus Vecturithrix granuli]|uniref:Uncharacterized protein n=1 Tax=Vecturithrix granuli TaxID=1499967 RepID=A0A081C052_VECG1|nr:hypothetical protein U27_04929 [Candidatus Vecturithrix granuli]
MLCRTFLSQRGFSLIRVLLALAILAVVAFYFLPYIGGDTLSILNQISGKVKVVVNALISKLSGLGSSLSGGFEGYWTKISRTLEEWADKWNLKKISQLVSGVEDEWQGDMEKLISISRSRGFDMSRVERNFDGYQAKEVSWKRVEFSYWEDIRQQTQEKIATSIERFRTRPLGCSDFVVELKTIWDIEQQFNQDTLEGYIDASESADRLQQPRSAAFLEEFLDWLAVASAYPSSGSWSNDWFMQQLTQAIPSASADITLDYPGIIKHIDTQVSRTPHPIYRILGNVTIAEIYLNYDLINPAEDRFDEAIRQLSEIVNRYQSTYNMSSLGLHMALGLLHERVCKNADLAMKEFKDVVAIARRLGLRCEDYSLVHYHLGVINLHLREGKEIRPTFEEAASAYAGTTQDLLAPTPTPLPTPVPPTPTPRPEPIEISIKIPRALGTVSPSGTRPERPGAGTGTPPAIRTPVPPPVATPVIVPTPAPTPGVQIVPQSGITPTPDWIKGTVSPGERRPERDIRLRPRPELGPSKKMKKFDIGDLYDLSRIPDDAIREFELYLQCHAEGERTTIARFIHGKYHGK